MQTLFQVFMKQFTCATGVSLPVGNTCIARSTKKTKQSRHMSNSYLTRLQQIVTCAGSSKAATLSSSKSISIQWDPKGQEHAEFSKGLHSGKTASQVLHLSCGRIYLQVQEINGRFAPRSLCQGCFQKHDEPEDRHGEELLRLLPALVPDAPHLCDALQRLKRTNKGLRLRRCEVARIVSNAIPELRWARQVATKVVLNRSNIFLLRERQSAVSQLYTPALDHQARQVFGNDWFQRIHKGFVEFCIDNVYSLASVMEDLAEGRGRTAPEIRTPADLKSEIILVLSYRHLIKRRDTKRKNRPEVNERIAHLVVSAARALEEVHANSPKSGKFRLSMNAYVWMDVFYCTSNDGKWDNEALMPYALFPVVYFRDSDIDDRGDHSRMWLAIENVIARESGLIFTNVSQFDQVWESEDGIVYGKVFMRPDVAVYAGAKWIGSHAHRLHTHHPDDKDKLLRFTLRTALTGIWPGMWQVSDTSGAPINQSWFCMQHDYGETDLVYNIASGAHGLVSNMDGNETDPRWWNPNGGYPAWDGLDIRNSRTFAEAEGEKASTIMSVMMHSFKSDYEKKTPFNATLSIGDGVDKECVVFLRAWRRDGLISDGMVGIVCRKTSKMVVRRELSGAELARIAQCLRTKNGLKVTLLDIENEDAALSQVSNLDLSSMWQRRSSGMSIDVDEASLLQYLVHVLRGNGWKFTPNVKTSVSQERHTARGELKMLEW